MSAKVIPLAKRVFKNVEGEGSEKRDSERHVALFDIRYPREKHEAREKVELEDKLRKQTEELGAEKDPAKVRRLEIAIEESKARLAALPEPASGLLVYIKSSLTDDEDPGIYHYKKLNKDFPHETTADQFFDEMQFEAYRCLGRHMAVEAVHELGELGEEYHAFEIKPECRKKPAEEKKKEAETAGAGR